MNLAQIYFFVCAAVAVFGAIVAVAASNPIRGALGLMVMILSIAGLYIGLSAEFIAVIQLIVYAGAVVVLFLFVIMLLGPDAASATDTRGIGPRVFGGALFAIAGIAALVLMVKTTKSHLVGPPSPDFGGVDALGRELFTTGIVPFELSSALLMVAILGAVAVAKGSKQGGLPGETEPLSEVRASLKARAEEPR